MASRYDVQKQATVSLLYSATTGDVTALRRFHGQVTQDYDDNFWLIMMIAITIMEIFGKYYDYDDDNGNFW